MGTIPSMAKGNLNEMTTLSWHASKKRENPSKHTMIGLPSVPGHEEFLVTGTFAQGLLLGPLSRKMQGTEPNSRDELTYRVEKYLRKIKGEERKQANLNVVVNAYLKQESADSHYCHSHKERKDGSHD
uniref:Uncharacterized protein n=1 Tax=Lactuca sativa TaxID=4236 RepID=A0A9R1UW49_LACSA|nr:hypothetical protein LSAT_V11C800447410 [Lactuca sativa]